MLDWLACTLVKGLSAALCRLPPEFAVRVGEGLGFLAYRLQPKRQRIGIANVLAAFDGKLDYAQADRVVRDSFRLLGAGILELLRLPVIDANYIERYVAIDGRERYSGAAAKGRPVIVLTGHYGNWELSPIASALSGYPIVALARAQKNFPRLYELLISYRESKGNTIVHKGGGLRHLIRAMKENKMIGIVGDQATKTGVMTPFLGRPALFAPGPFELAYNHNAIIVPIFSHRISGPHTRITVEPPFDLSDHPDEGTAVRAGIERFASDLARHITEEPYQWLWMHKRWKYTPARRVVVLSDGKAGHRKQSLAIVEALREKFPALTERVVEIRYRSRLARSLCLLAGPHLADRRAVAMLRRCLTPESADALLRSYADLIVSAGSSCAPVALMWSRLLNAKTAVIMAPPAPLPLKRFDLVIVPRHDSVPPAKNVVEIDGAVSRMSVPRLSEAAARLNSHPGYRTGASGGPNIAQPVIALFVGGDTPQHEFTPAFVEAMVSQVIEAAERAKAAIVVTTSRRTPAAAEAILERTLAAHPRCRLLVLASRHPLEGTLDGMLGLAQLAVVTGESISMISEACASGRKVVVVEPPLRRSTKAVTKHRRFLTALVEGQYVRTATAQELAAVIGQTLAQKETHRRLETPPALDQALEKLLR